MIMDKVKEEEIAKQQNYADEFLQLSITAANNNRLSAYS